MTLPDEASVFQAKQTLRLGCGVVFVAIVAAAFGYMAHGLFGCVAHPALREPDFVIIEARNRDAG